MLLIVCTSGCSSSITGPARDIGHARERAMAEIAIASVTSGTPTVAPELKVGDKCPDCNDPPGACGVGKVGDGRSCQACGTCGGDGKIDRRDIRSDIGSEPVDITILSPIEEAAIEAKSVVEVQKEITLHWADSSRQSWPSAWVRDDVEQFTAAGWEVRAVKDLAHQSKISYFDVVAPDGEVFQFFEPITLDPNDKDKQCIRHLETR